MLDFQDSGEILINETERKPNLYAANVLSGVVAVITIACTINELGIFELSKFLVRVCCAFAILTFATMQIFVRIRKLLSHPFTKYLIMSIVLLLVLTVSVLLNINAILGFVLPLLLATQYRSHHLSATALVGSILCCGVAPILAFLLGTWNLNFLTGYIQVFCRVTIDITAGNTLSVGESIQQILLYWSMPQMLTLGAFGVILFSVTKSGIASVKNQIQVIDLGKDLKNNLESITSMQERMLYAMSDIIETRDIETGGHVRRTIEVVKLLTSAMLNDPTSGVSEDFCRNVVRSAPMHDLGKIAIPDAILHKPAKLTAEEYEVVKQHPLKSASIITEALTGIEDEQLLLTAKNIALYHHERMDGKGYPEGLKGKAIPLEARIMAIADVYDALVSERCYKQAMSFEEAFQTIEECMGTQFDPSLNKYFVACRKQIERFYECPVEHTAK